MRGAGWLPKWTHAGGQSPKKTMDLAIAALMIENVPEAKRQRKTHARTRLGPKMEALRKLITEANNGSRDAPTTV